MGLFSRFIKWVDDLFTPNEPEPEPRRPRRKSRQSAKRKRQPSRTPRSSKQTPPGDPWPDIPDDFKGYNSDTGWFRILRYSDIGMSDWRDVKGNTNFDDAREADLFTIEIKTPGGNLIYRNFVGPIQDLQRTIDYLKSINSL